jgi:hypothetical protein
VGVRLPKRSNVDNAVIGATSAVVGKMLDRRVRCLSDISYSQPVQRHAQLSLLCIDKFDVAVLC